MTKTILPIANGSYISDSLPISAQECTNWYPNIPQTAALNSETLLGTPGLTLATTTGAVGSEVNRGSWTMDGVPYFVNGTTLYRLESDLTTMTDLGAITGSGRVFMADNGTQLCVLVPGTTSMGYIFTTGPDTLTTITDLDFNTNGEPQAVVFIDGYFVFTTDSKKFIISALNDGLSYSALDFGSAEADPDDIVAPIVFRNQLFICGSETIEAFQNIGGGDFPFQRTGLFIAKGVYAALTLIQSNDTFMFIGGGKGESPAIWAFEGNTAVKVSTTAIDSLLQTFTEAEISASFAVSYAQKGAYFVCFALPTVSLVFDTTSKRWHERKSQVLIETTQLTKRWRVNSLVSAYGKVLVGDSQDGRIGCISSAYKEYEQAVVRVVSTQPFQNNMDSFSVPEIELTVESGVGNDDVIEPLIGLSISKDGGKTFGQERWRKIGKIGEFDRRLIWRRNGRMSRFTVFKFTLSDAVKPVIIQLTADIS